MFESAELGHKIDKATYDKEVPLLREALLDAQLDLAQSGMFPVIVLLGGVDGAGRGETVNLLNEWMDPRHVQSHGMGEPSDEELDRPMMWRFWRALPPKGKIGVFLGSWYTWPILNRVNGVTKTADLDQSLERAKRLEKMLTDEGALIIKFWLHLSKDKQEKRLKVLEKDPKTRWRVTERDWEHFKLYDKFRTVHESVIRHTSTAEAPWFIVEGEDPRYRSLTIGKMIQEAIRKRLDTPEKQPTGINAPPLLPSIDHLHILKTLDLTQKIEKKKFEEELEKYQGKLALLTRDPRFREITVVLVFEGNDAAGKGGSIRRITSALDARIYQVVPIAAPTEEERAQPYQWRFWRHIPRRGRVTIFDRSWYGRVLVERVEGYCSEADWMRAYTEINDFEAQLTRHNIVVSKFWLTISKDEQLRRFKEREKTGFKRYKITDEDWRNREKWDAYEQAICDMVDRTSTEASPWTLVEANDKYFARIKILKTLCSQIEARLKNLPKNKAT
ncbi:polyphosphate:AMP phosphotransferase [Sulfurimicrobium lacus]|uniref:Polyphosphate:AMP phosphotransferase n=1 Tax=Sulfurimicrobium lacus TaxID=2715678 RepID=A0A6F8V881_9PROT|nr:polyphosphate:AMP phosphotransferase [Sulfurimicrobium lacus]BCB25327.1 polyphosphate:AMP phosphotransferase [Sulfurimicrobium lacus]